MLSRAADYIIAAGVIAVSAYVIFSVWFYTQL